jgi:thiosulfate/3-mercaptopyruvate sulfurtransferase
MTIPKLFPFLSLLFLNYLAHSTAWTSPRLKRNRAQGTFPFLLLVALAASFFLLTSRSASAKDLDLIESSTLKGNESGWTILDARPKNAWKAGHIPGARSFSWEDHTRTDETGVPFRVLPPQEMASILGAMSISEKTPIVVYGDADSSWGGEGWTCWLLSWLGHAGPIRLLAGGVQAWRNQGYPLARGEEQVNGAPARYEVNLRPEILITSAELVKNRTSLSIIDTRSGWEWFTGHIPLAVHIPWQDFYTGEDRRPIGPANLRKLLRKHGVSLDKPVVYYCTGGVRSAYTWLVHELAGLPTARNYEGGMEEWKRRFFTHSEDTVETINKNE